MIKAMIYLNPWYNEFLLYIFYVHDVLCSFTLQFEVQALTLSKQITPSMLTAGSMVKKLPSFNVPYDSSPHSQRTTTGPYPQPHDSRPLLTPFLHDQSEHYSPM
jgi:hypothetical protein